MSLTIIIPQDNTRRQSLPAPRMCSRYILALSCLIDNENTLTSSLHLLKRLRRALIACGDKDLRDYFWQGVGASTCGMHEIFARCSSLHRVVEQCMYAEVFAERRPLKRKRE